MAPQQGHQVLAAVVEPEGNLTKIQVEVSPRHAPVGIQPVLGVAPEALDAVDVWRRARREPDKQNQQNGRPYGDRDTLQRMAAMRGARTPQL